MTTKAMTIAQAIKRLADVFNARMEYVKENYPCLTQEEQYQMVKTSIFNDSGI